MKQKSFTLIELLVVIVIIGILAGVIVVSTSSAINKANFAKAQAFSSTAQNELLSDLVSEWTFDVSGSPTEDTWGNNNGTVYGATYQTKSSGNCVYGGCYSFNGTTDYIDCGNGDILETTLPFSFSAWFKTDITSDTSYMILTKDTGVFPYAFLTVRNQKVSFRYSDTGNDNPIYSLEKVNDNLWHFVIGQYNGAKIELYYDGKFQAEKAVATPVSTIGKNITIGRYQETSLSYFQGSIDDVRIYKATLSSTQIKEQYLAGLDSLLSSNQISEKEYNQRLNVLAYEK